MNNKHRIISLTLISALMSGCAGMSNSNQPTTSNAPLTCAAIGGTASGITLAVMGAGSAVTGFAATGAMLSLLACPQTQEHENERNNQAELPATHACEIAAQPGAHLDKNGCAYDTDNDSVVDGVDLCLATPAGVVVDSYGCPLNSDGDAVEDYKDSCPETQKGDIVDSNGCPILAEVIVTFANITFAFDSANLTHQAVADLNQVLEKLKQVSQSVPIRVEGHTDSIGSDTYNKALSKRRANAVMYYLIEGGIDAQRFKNVALGEAVPVANNDSRSGRAINRRVEISLGL